MYKQNLALIQSIDDKIKIRFIDHNEKSVRPKDLFFLHPGPVTEFPQRFLEGDVEEAWKLLQGNKPSLKEISELIYGEYTPESVWSAYQLINKTPYFKGTIDEIYVNTPEDVEKALLASKKKLEDQKRWEQFIKRVKKGLILKEDRYLLIDLEDFARKKSKSSKILKELNIGQTPENAHELLLKWQVWGDDMNPWISRFSVDLNDPEIPLATEEEVDRLDLTNLEAFAIDDEETDDPDDALSIEGDALWIHIADVASLVAPGSLADLEAMKRGSNLYLPEKKVNMLPSEVTQKLGLGLNEISPAFSIKVFLDEEGELVDCQIALTRIRVTRMTYQQAQERIEEYPFSKIKSLTDKFHRKRLENGALEITLPSVSVTVRNGDISINPLVESASRDLVMDAMLIAGKAVAEFSIKNNISLPFVIQKSPEFKKSLGSDLVSQYKMRRLLQRSRISVSPGRHAGLGMDVYCRVTSPLRRYTDLIVVQQVRAFLLGRPLISQESLHYRVGMIESSLGGLNQVERQSILFWKVSFLRRTPDWTGEAVLVRQHKNFGVFLIPFLALDVNIPLNQEIDLNTRVRVKLESTDLSRMSVTFGLID